MGKSTIAIVIPAYNEERHIQACLESITQQTEQPDEVILVDNNSTDKTVEIARSYPFVRVVHERRQGVVFARDAGFDAVRSEIIGRIDADTILPPGWVHYIKRFYSEERHQDYAISGGCYFYNVRLKGFAAWWQGQIAFRMNRLLMGHYILFGSNMAIPTKIWKKVRKEVCHDTDVHEDLDLAIHVHRAGYQIAYRESLKVGVKMRRVRSNRHELWDNLKWWPKTLRRHDKKTWVFGWVGALVLFVASPVVVLVEYLARLIGRDSLSE